MSTFVEVPGGRAELFDKDELTARRKRPSKLLMTAHADLVQKVATAATVVSPDGRVEINKDLTGAELHLTEEDALNLDRLQDASTWALLKSWEHTCPGCEDRTHAVLDGPTPPAPDDLLDLPADLYDALKLAATEHSGVAAELAELFEAPEDADGNPNHPGRASGTSRASSGAIKQPSDRKRPTGSKSTGPAKRSAGRTTSS